MRESQGLVLIGGGARSGKSRFATACAARHGGAPFFLATAQPHDEEMRARIARHQLERGDRFTTIEEPIDVPARLRTMDASELVLIDCLTLWLTNLLLRGDDEASTLRAVDELIAAARDRHAPTLLVTNEVGMSIVPQSSLGRVFRDVAGLAHQRLGRAATEVYLAVLGMILRLKPAPVQTMTKDGAC